MDNDNNVSFTELQNFVSICLDEIIKLKDENTTLNNKINSLNSLILDLVRGNQSLLTSTDALHNRIEAGFSLITNSINNVKYEINDPYIKDRDLFFPQFYSIDYTIDLIINCQKSLARFGDGEFSIMCNYTRHNFQHLDPMLAARLIEVIHSQNDNLLIGIADNYGSLEAYSKNSQQEIRLYMTDKVRKQHQSFLEPGRVYHNAYISRPYVLYADHNTKEPLNRFNRLKMIWNNRKIIFVEGSLTRLGYGNDLFNNASDIKRIEAPATNSFDKYEAILNACLKHAQKGTLFLIALGPSAGVLAYDLCIHGHQAIDIGHLDLEYEWFLKGLGKRCKIKYKYNNELTDGNIVEDIFDKKFFNQVIEIL